MTHSDSTPGAPRGFALALLLVASMLGTFIPRVAAAQSDAPDCIAIVAEMLKPTPSAGTIRASAGCPSSGPVTLANRWTQRGGRGPTERDALVEASSWVRDARLYDAVSTVVRDVSYPIADRLAGMRVLVAYADEGFRVSQQGEALSARPARVATQADGPPPVDGRIPMRSTMREEVKREMARLASGDRDPDMRRSAQRACATLGCAVPAKGK
ncbi:MAG: hypothetical protein DMD35_21575 [Gemmatimonadetes bacterium]|nr:MAG: hypothetical protein DMD35_21575 [Gemmatimonadota bacterium]